MEFIGGYGFSGEQPRAYASWDAKAKVWRWKLLGMSGLLCDGTAESRGDMLEQLAEVAPEFT